VGRASARIQENRSGSGTTGLFPIFAAVASMEWLQLKIFSGRPSGAAPGAVRPSNGSMPAARARRGLPHAGTTHIFARIASGFLLLGLLPAIQIHVFGAPQTPKIDLGPYSQSVDPATFVPRALLAKEEIFQNYAVRIFDEQPMGRGSFEILKDGRRVWAQTGKLEIVRFYIGTQEKNELPMGRDITADGVPDLVIREWSGGVHCCFIFHVFQIAADFRWIASLNATHGDGSHFEDFDGDGILEFFTADFTFAYWHTSFLGSPSPVLILRFKDGAYVVAADLMRRPAPSDAEIRNQIAKANEDNEQPSPQIWGYMLDLIYSGNADAAWRFFDQAWPSNQSGKEDFLSEFRRQLAKSPYWPGIQSLNVSEPK
jgi:hypothetical protein